MRKSKLLKDPEIRVAMAALRQAAKNALQLAKETGTPCYIWRDGKIVNINPHVRKNWRRSSRTGTRARIIP